MTVHDAHRRSRPLPARTGQRTSVPAHLAARPRRAVACSSTPTSTTAPAPTAPGRGPAPPTGDARHRAVRRDVLRAVRLRALAARRHGGARRPGRAGPAGCCCSAGWRGCCRSTTRSSWSSGRPTNPSLPGHWQDLLLHLTFTHVYSDDYIFWTVGPAWSLGVEFHFYVADGAVRPARPSGGTPRRSRAARVAAVAALPRPARGRRDRLPGLERSTWRSPPHEDWSAWFSPLSRAADFGLGTGLAVARRDRRPARPVDARRPRRHRHRRAGRCWSPPGRSRSSASGGTRRTPRPWRRPGRRRAPRRAVAAGPGVAAAGRARRARLRGLPDPRAGDAVPGSRRRCCPRRAPVRSSWSLPRWSRCRPSRSPGSARGPSKPLASRCWR